MKAGRLWTPFGILRSYTITHGIWEQRLGRRPERAYRVFTHFQTLELSPYPHNIFHQYTPNSLAYLAEWPLRVNEMWSITRCS